MSTYEPKVGDRVRVTVECTVGYVKDADYFSADGWDFGLDDPAVSVEKVAPPLPTTPGSVIRERATDLFLHLNGNGKWVSDGGVIYDPINFSDAAGFDIEYIRGQVNP